MMKRDVPAITDAIRQSVTALQVGETLGLRPDRHGRCACPVHNGVDHNMRLYPDDRGYHCFVCGAHGDVIGLVKAVNGCAFWQAVEWLNSAFCLGLPIDRPLDKNAAEVAQIAQKRKRAERAAKKAAAEAEFELYLQAVKLANDLELCAELYRPTVPDAEWDERFCEAMRLLPEARELADRMAATVIGVRC